MRILYYIPYLNTGLGADFWIYEGWRFAFEDLGHEFHLVTDFDDMRATAARLQPALLFIPNLANLLLTHLEVLKDIKRSGIKVFLIVYWPLRPVEIAAIRDGDPADIYFGEREPESMTRFIIETGKPYHLVPNAANKRWHHPAAASPRFAYDIAFVGGFL